MPSAKREESFPPSAAQRKRLRLNLLSKTHAIAAPSAVGDPHSVLSQACTSPAGKSPPLSVHVFRYRDDEPRLNGVGVVLAYGLTFLFLAALLLKVR